MKALIIFAIFFILLTSGRPRSKYLVTIENKRGRTEVFRTNDTRLIDSLFTARIGGCIPDSLLSKSRFFELRTERLTFYCEIK